MPLFDRVTSLYGKIFRLPNIQCIPIYILNILMKKKHNYIIEKLILTWLLNKLSVSVKSFWCITTENGPLVLFSAKAEHGNCRWKCLVCQISLHLNIKNQTQNEKSHKAELLERYPPVPVLVCVDDGFVDDLLQLGVLQVIPYHHLQHLEQLTVGYVAILIHVINPERNCRNKQRVKTCQKRRQNAVLQCTTD